MRTILSHIKPYRFAMGIAFALMLIELTIELFQPFLISKIIDDGIIGENMSIVIRWGALLIGFSFIAFIAGVVNSYYSAHASQGTGFSIRQGLYEKVQALSSSQFDRFSNSSLMTRMTNDVSQVQNVLFMIMRVAMRAPLLVVGGVIMSLLINVKLALILIISVPLLTSFVIYIMRKVGPLFRAIQKQLDFVNGIMQENLIAMRIIKAFRRKRYEVKRFTVASGELRDRTIRTLRTIEITMPLVMLLMNVCIILILLFGNFQIDDGQATVGNIVALINYSMRITMALGMMTWIISSFARASASAERIEEVLVVGEEMHDASDEQQAEITAGHIQFNDVSFRYPNEPLPVLQHITFEAKAGQRIAILGATGSGKSSLFRLIPRLYDVEKGSITIDGIDIRQIKFEELRKKIGFVPQEVLLFSGTIKENILWGNEDATFDDVMDAAKRAQIHDTIMQLPKQYDTVIGQRGVNLSGGQKQRLSIARALVRHPRILLLDDSTSALDARTEAHLLEAIEHYDCTSLIITQKLSTAMKADHIVLLDHGELLDQGDHETLLKRSTLYRKIYESQYGEEGAHLAYGTH